MTTREDAEVAGRTQQFPVVTLVPLASFVRDLVDLFGLSALPYALHSKCTNERGTQSSSVGWIGRNSTLSIEPIANAFFHRQNVPQTALTLVQNTHESDAVLDFDSHHVQ